jgi:DNA-binding response OmpR family regulator
VVFITATTDASTRERALRDGALDYLTKPFDEDGLLDIVRAAIEAFTQNEPMATPSMLEVDGFCRVESKTGSRSPSTTARPSTPSMRRATGTIRPSANHRNCQSRAYFAV